MPLIKRYANRKLYDTEAKRYVTLDGIAELIRQQQDVQVIDHETGEDITAITQAQIIFEQERKIKGGIPHAVFTSLIQAGSDTLSQLRHALIPPVEWQKEVDGEIERRVAQLIQSGRLSEDDGLHILSVLLSPSAGVTAAPSTGGEAPPPTHARALPTRADVAAITRQIDALTAEIEELARRKSA